MSSFYPAAFALFAITIATPCHARPKLTDDQLGHFAAQCAPNIGATTLRGIVNRESAKYQYAIGIHDNSVYRPRRQPTSLAEAMEMATALDAVGVGYSVGPAQINISNVRAYGVTLAASFDVCQNLKMAQRILGDCYARSNKHSTDEQQRIQLALSCYNSGNFSTGFRNGYVDGVRSLALQRNVTSASPTGQFAQKAVIQALVKSPEQVAQDVRLADYQNRVNYWRDLEIKARMPQQHGASYAQD